MSSTDIVIAESTAKENSTRQLGAEEVEAAVPETPKSPLNGNERPSLMERIFSPRTPSTPSSGGGIRGWVGRALSRAASALTPRTPQTGQPEEDIDVPQRFLDACGGNRRKAIAKYKAMRQWRKERKIDDLLTKHHPQYADIRRAYPQMLHGRALGGEIVSIELPAKLDMDLLRQKGITAEDLATHLALMYEWTDRLREPGKDNQAVTVMDVKDIPLAKLASPDWLAIIRATTEVMDHYYPGRQKKILIVNTPMLFGTVFKIIKGVMPGSMGQVVEIISVKDLQKHIAADQLPPMLGGSSTVALGEDVEERAATEYFTELNARAEAAAAGGSS